MWTAISWEVRMDDWRQLKVYFAVAVDLNRDRIFLNGAMTVDYWMVDN